MPIGTNLLYNGPDKFAIFTWHGCRLRLIGNATIYLSPTETPMPQYLAAHGQINRRRNRCCAEKTIGPIVLVAGGANSGKTTLCKILLNYAVKSG